jgi:hypothetical protein
VLTHLRDAASVVANWTTQLEDRGLLLLEETEAIDTDHPVFTRYLRMVEEMLAGNSNQLYAGHIVASVNLPDGLNPIMNEPISLPVPNRDAACMFLLNLRTWKDSEFVRTNYARDSILELENSLAEIARYEPSACDIEWKLRQAAWLKI